MSEVKMTVAGQAYGGWEMLTVNRGIKQIAGEFTLTASERFPGNWAGQPFKGGEYCTVTIGKDVVITGYIDEPSPRFDANGHQVSVSGRDKAGDLVDCSAIHASGHWRGATVLQIVQDLAAPFGISAIAAADPGKPFSDFAIQEGETAFEAISRAAAMRGLLAISDPVGGVVLARAGTARHSIKLEQGINILAGEGQYSMRDRFSRYIAKGQRRGTDDDTGSPELLSGPSGEVTDSGVTRYRPLIVLAEDQGDGITFKQRAEWERNVRQGQSKVLRVTVQGWRERGDKGELWEPNKLVRVTAPWLWIDEDLLISGVTYSLSERGTLTDIELTDPKAFELLPEGKA